MFTLFLMSMWTYFSGMAGGGVCGKAVGTARVIITGVGVIMTMFQRFISMSTRVGEDTTGIISGAGTDGTMNEFLTGDFNRTGRGGTIIGTGEEKEPGVSRAIEIARQSTRGRNLDIKESRNITRGLRFRNISSGDKSEKESIKVKKAGNIKVRKVENIGVEKVERIEAEKAGGIKVRGNTRIRPNDI
jgi:hypothetical protein